MVGWIFERRAVEVVRRSFLERGCKDMTICDYFKVMVPNIIKLYQVKETAVVYMPLRKLR